MFKHIVFDTNTNTTVYRDRDGEEFAAHVVDAAESAAARGDADAIAFLERFEPPKGIDPIAWSHQLMDDCPECQAARARGEKPLIFFDRAAIEKITAHRGFKKRPRWRDLKRRVRRTA